MAFPMAQLVILELAQPPPDLNTIGAALGIIGNHIAHGVSFNLTLSFIGTG
jgi:hypothetical protein